MCKSLCFLRQKDAKCLRRSNRHTGRRFSSSPPHHMNHTKYSEVSRLPKHRAADNILFAKILRALHSFFFLFYHQKRPLFCSATECISASPKRLRSHRKTPPAPSPQGASALFARSALIYLLPATYSRKRTWSRTVRILVCAYLPTFYPLASLNFEEHSSEKKFLDTQNKLPLDNLGERFGLSLSTLRPALM